MPPPDGSGTVIIYDLMQNQYVGTYSPDSFIVTAGPCTYYFTMAQLNPRSGDGLYKLVLDDAGLSGNSCPEEPTPCYHSYWATASAAGVFAFVDAGAGACPAFFALAGPDSSESQGTLTVVGVSTGRSTAWVPPGYGGNYSVAAGTVTLSSPGCSGTYKVDPTSETTLPMADPAASPGTATIAFAGSATCPATECFEAGYSVIWDASGEPFRNR
jgi:hypothetical protein